MKRFKHDFPSKLEGIDFKTLENSCYSIYALSKDFELIYFNPGWIRFAKENQNGSDVVNEFPIGTPITGAIQGAEVQDFYFNHYQNVMKTGKIWHHEYECSSSTEFRQLYQITYPLKDANGILVINTLMVDIPMAQIGRKAFAAIEERYTQSTGFINQCSNCRRTQRTNQLDVWDWVPAWIKIRPKNISHSICPVCYDYHWKYSRD